MSRKKKFEGGGGAYDMQFAYMHVDPTDEENQEPEYLLVLGCPVPIQIPEVRLPT